MTRELRPTVLEIIAAIRLRARTAALCIALWFAALVMALSGAALAAVAFAAGAGLAAGIDRRLPLFVFLLMLPGLTAFDGLVLLRFGGSALDFRLILTGSIGVVLVALILKYGTTLDVVAAVFAAFVGTMIVLIVESDTPMRGLPEVARLVDYLLAYLVARRSFGSVSGLALLAAAVAIGGLVPLMSGLIQLVRGEAVFQNGAFRLTGVYSGSPVGLAFAMFSAALALYFTFMTRLQWRRSAAWAAVVVFGLFFFVLVETSSRLAFMSIVFSLFAGEILLRHWRRLPVIAAVAVCALLLAPGLSGRLGSVTGNGNGGGETTTIGGATTTTSEGNPSGDPSLDYRVYLWETMLGQWRHSPLTGLGTGSFPVVFERISGTPRVPPENDYVGIIVESGLVGISIYLFGQLAVIVVGLYRFRRAERGPTGTAIALALTYFVGSNIVSVLCNPILFLDLQVAVWALLGSALAIPIATSSELRGHEGGPGRWGRVILIEDLTPERVQRWLGRWRPANAVTRVSSCAEQGA